MRRAGADARKALDHSLIALAPLVTACLLVRYLVNHEFAIDFAHVYWSGAQRILHGLSPYRFTRQQLVQGEVFTYPALTGIVMIPFGLLPRDLATAIWVAGSLAAIPAILRILSVRDWRLYPLTFLLWTVINAWQSGNLTLVLALLIALMWRWRDSPLRSGLLVALAISLKPVVWPLALWLLATRRFRATGWAIVAGLLVNLAAWPILGFGAIHRYLHLDSVVSAEAARTGYALVAIVLRAGGSRSLGSTVLLLVSAALAVGVLWLGLRRRREDAALAVAIALMLAASPLVWNHYFALLVVPVAIARPRLSREWLAMLPFWLCPALHVTEWQALLAAGLTAWITWRLVCRPGSDEGRAGAFDVLAAAERRQGVGDALATG